jgi:hypothetical protein
VGYDEKNENKIYLPNIANRQTYSTVFADCLGVPLVDSSLTMS